MIQKMIEMSSIEISPEFNENRQKGENDSTLCELIRSDSIEKFIFYVNKNNISLSSELQPSIFETNQLLLRKNPTLIEYASFYGSIQIIKYLHLNQIEFPRSIFQYAIHSKNEELFYFLQENSRILNEETVPILLEAIKCHHNVFSNYIIEQFLKDDDCNKNDIYEYSFRFYNYENIRDFSEVDISKIIEFICLYNHISFLEKVFDKFELKAHISDILKTLSKKECNETIQFLIKKIELDEINERMFQGFEKLTLITIPSSVKKIGKWAFEGCFLLRQVSFDKESKLEIIDDYSFMNCISLSKIILPPTTKIIGKRAFERCLSLKEFRFEDPTKIEFICDNSFEGSPIKVKKQTQNEILIDSNISFIKRLNIEYGTQYKICILGDESVGKTSIAFLYTKKEVLYDSEPTIGSFFFGNEKFAIWDTSGNEKYYCILPVFISCSTALLIVFDISRRNSFESLNFWIELSRKKGRDSGLDFRPKTSLILVGDKCDKNRAVSREEAEKVASENNMSYFEVSANNGSCIDELFDYIYSSINAKFFYIDI